MTIAAILSLIMTFSDDIEIIKKKRNKEFLFAIGAVLGLMICFNLPNDVGMSYLLVGLFTLTYFHSNRQF